MLPLAKITLTLGLLRLFRVPCLLPLRQVSPVTHYPRKFGQSTTLNYKTATHHYHHSTTTTTSRHNKQTHPPRPSPKQHHTRHSKHHTNQHNRRSTITAQRIFPIGAGVDIVFEDVVNPYHTATLMQNKSTMYPRPLWTIAFSVNPRMPKQCPYWSCGITARESHSLIACPARGQNILIALGKESRTWRL